MIKKLFRPNYKAFHSGILRASTATSSLYPASPNVSLPSKFTQKHEFEGYAFARLYMERKRLGLGAIYRCQNARMDGHARVNGTDETVLIEIKHTLGWSSMCTAYAQFLIGNQLLDKRAKKGVIIFREFSKGWKTKDGNNRRPWAQLCRHIDELSTSEFTFDALQLLEDGSFSKPLVDVAR